MAQRILIIDDEPDICTLLSSVLKTDGNETYVAHNLADGQTLFTTKCPDIVFLDLNLPDGSGFSLLPKLKKEIPGSKVVICSAYDGVTERETATQYGADYFISKPFKLKKIKAVIAEINIR